MLVFSVNSTTDFLFVGHAELLVDSIKDADAWVSSDFRMKC